jgi:hypothetical protein
MTFHISQGTETNITFTTHVIYHLTVFRIALLMANQETNNFSDHSEITDSSQKKMHVDLHQNECEIIQDQAIPCENLGNSTLLLSPSEIKPFRYVE